MSEEKRFIDVAAGLILTRDGQLLLAQRPGDKAWSGWWELPGGKLEPGETATEALVRELHEELGITVTQSRAWVTYTHEYPKTIVRLAFHQVTEWEGEPSGLEGQDIAWTPVQGPVSVSPLLPATKPPLRWLQLPDRYLLTSIGAPEGLQPFLQKLDAALNAGLRLVQFREPAWAQQSTDPDERELYDAFRQVLSLCHKYRAFCLVNSVHPAGWAEEADGIHYRAADAATLARDLMANNTDDNVGDARCKVNNRTGVRSSALPGASRGDHYVGMSAHNEQDLEVARQIGADFAVLGHVLDTPSHPGEPGMGWHGFSELNKNAGLPVFALGGQSPESAGDAATAGAHGIAGIRLVDALTDGRL